MCGFIGLPIFFNRDEKKYIKFARLYKLRINMSCGCGTSGDSGLSCGTKAATGCENVDKCGNSYKLSVFDWLSGVGNPAVKPEMDFVEVRFKNDRKSFYRNIHQLPLQIGSIVTVEASPGHDIGVVSLTGELVKIQMKKKRFSEEQSLKIYRISNQKDIEVWQESRKKEDAIKTEAKIIAARLNLEMKIADVEFQGDGSKATFYYTADNRVDFRQLIKEYAAAFKTKIDMKQIGFRQEAAKIGGIGSCGRELCCSSWLTDFRSVNTNAARYQQLSINPQKLAGQCGKLKCCLNYELDSYLDALSLFPPTNTTLDTEKGKAFCIKIDVFKQKMWFAYVENSLAWYDIDIQSIKKQIANNKKGIKTPPLEELVAGNTLLEVPKPVDLIQENNVDRFEKRKPSNKKGSKQQKSNSQPPKQTKPKVEKAPAKNEAGAQPQNSGNGGNKKRKSFKKNNQKPNNSNNNE